ncbi:hypothetical protein [Legionella worsleiensis]|uniref:Uncharacterized protein n=1 Tax=Legionella worsleiensis TaxID=45076 RepID=A0A0W1AKM7_9GAMM|nr:hypothetical protein [Legionella worsleiensis]KTD81879.1 hypothetical protein Lwor_0182 [Legionella worsleiensis]STY31166.1 Uncharacterised protein [Legionella worsleiensis]
MRFYCLLIGFIFSIEVYGNVLKPCEAVGFDNLIEYITVSDGHLGLSFSDPQEEPKLIELFKKCIHTAAVCMVDIELNRKEKIGYWISEEFIPPVDGNFDPVERELIFALLQYIDKKSGAGVCIVAKNNFAMAIPWHGRNWVVTDQGINDYEIYGSQLTTVMTPNSLYEAMLDIHNEAVWMSEHRRK